MHIKLQWNFSSFHSLNAIPGFPVACMSNRIYQKITSLFSTFGFSVLLFSCWAALQFVSPNKLAFQFFSHWPLCILQARAFLYHSSPVVLGTNGQKCLMCYSFAGGSITSPAGGLSHYCFFHIKCICITRQTHSQARTHAHTQRAENARVKCFQPPTVLWLQYFIGCAESLRLCWCWKWWSAAIPYREKRRTGFQSISPDSSDRNHSVLS